MLFSNPRIARRVEELVKMAEEGKQLEPDHVEFLELYAADCLVDFAMDGGDAKDLIDRVDEARKG